MLCYPWLSAVPQSWDLLVPESSALPAVRKVSLHCFWALPQSCPTPYHPKVTCREFVCLNPWCMMCVEGSTAVPRRGAGACSGQCPWAPIPAPHECLWALQWGWAGLDAPAASSGPTARECNHRPGCWRVELVQLREREIPPWGLCWKQVGGRDCDGSAPGAAPSQVRGSDDGRPTPCRFPAGKTPQAILFPRKVHRRGAAQCLPEVSGSPSNHLGQWAFFPFWGPPAA